jgi:two-component system OmpR family sensor kinase
MPRSLTVRLTVTAVGLVAAVSLVVAVFATIALKGYLYDQLDHQLQENAAFATSVVGAPDGYVDVCEAVGRPGLRLPGGVGALSGNLDPDCRAAYVLGESPESTGLSSDDLATLDAVLVGTPTTVDLDGYGAYRVLVLDSDQHTIVTGLPADQVQETVNRLIGWEALFVLLGVLAAAGAGSFLVRRQLAPLREVAATAQEVSTMPLEAGAVGVTARVPEELTDPATEVGRMGAALNTMLSHIESALDARHRSEQQVRRFVADVSHELRTPLSTIQGYAELTQRSEHTDAAAYRHAMAKVETESDRMSALVDDLLLLARLDAGRPLERTDVDLTRLAVEAVNDIRIVDGERRWRLSLPDEPVHVVGDEQRLRQVVANLVANARRHTGPGTTVTVSASVADGGTSARLRVHDDGPGMPETLRGKEFERFSRGDSSRTRASGGSGLGLSIVKAIVEAHHGSVSVDSAPGDTAVVVNLPVVDHVDLAVSPVVGVPGSDDRSEPS